MKIQSILGPLDSGSLGQTLIHEHISCADWSMRANFGARFFERDTLLEMAKRCFAPLRQHGVKTIVDGTPVNLGRDLPLIRDVAEATGMNIIASSGFYFQEEPWLGARSEAWLYDMLYPDAESCGIMKCAVEAAGVTPLTQKLLRATGRVAAEQNKPVFCHTASKAGMGLPAFEQLSAFAPPERIVLGHSGDTNDRDYLLAIAATGAYLGFDRFGYCDRDNSVENLTANIVWLCERGYRDRILLSHDAAVYLAFWDDWAESQKQTTNFCFIHETVLPMLTAGGLTKADLAAMLEDNPRRLFEGA